MARLILYHGSSQIIETPEFGKGKTYNDYGQGFYCTEEIELAKEWACLEGIDGYVNRYSIALDSLNILDLRAPSYSILHWLTLLTENRQITISTPMMKKGISWLQERFHIDITPYDAIIGYRADDSYFSFARAFLSNQISFNQLSYAMKLGRLRDQFTLKSKKAFQELRFEGYESVESSRYYAMRKSRDEEARASYLQILDSLDEDGVYLRDLIRKEKM